MGPRGARAGAGGSCIRGIRALAVAVVGVVALLGGCGDVVDVDVTLDTTSLVQDFGAPAGTIPAIPCGAADAGLCGMLPVPAGIAGLRVACDLAIGQCFGEADVRLVQPIDMSQEGTLGSQLEREAIQYLRWIDVAFTIPKNTLSFALGKIDLFVSGAATAASGGTAAAASGGTAVLAGGAAALTVVDPASGPLSADDVWVGSMDPLAAGQTVTAAHHLRIVGGSPAHAAVEALVREGRSFALVLVLSPRVVGGSLAPGGAIQIDLRPTLRIGVPWSELL